MPALVMAVPITMVLMPVVIGCLLSMVTVVLIGHYRRSRIGATSGGASLSLMLMWMTSYSANPSMSVALGS